MAERPVGVQARENLCKRCSATPATERLGLEEGDLSDDPKWFDEFVTGRGPALLRFAYLLSGDYGLAEDLVQGALVKAHRRWADSLAADHPEAYVRRIITNDFTSWRRRRASRVVVGQVPDTPYGDATDPVGDRDLM